MKASNNKVKLFAKITLGVLFLIISFIVFMPSKLMVVTLSDEIKMSIPACKEYKEKFAEKKSYKHGEIDIMLNLNEDCVNAQIEYLKKHGQNTEGVTVKALENNAN